MKALKGRINDPVFTSLAAGVYKAQLAGYELKIIKRANADWVAEVVGTGEVLAMADSRVKVLKEAYYNVMFQESQRLDWVLSNQPYREYEDGNHPRQKKAETESDDSPLIESIENVDEIQPIVEMPVLAQIRAAKERDKPKRGRPRKDSKVTQINTKHKEREERARMEAERHRQRAEQGKAIDGEAVFEKLAYIAKHYELRSSNNALGSRWFKFGDRKNEHGRILEDHSKESFTNELKAFEDILIREGVIDQSTASEKANEWNERYGLVNRMTKTA